MPKHGKARDNTQAWVIITGDNKLLKSYNFRRTENFLKRFETYALISQFRVMNRPFCPKCKNLMKLAIGKGFGSRYWRCDNPKVHAKYTREDWDSGLPEKFMKFLEKERKVRKPYRLKLKAQGKEPGAAARKRKRWKVTKPENLKN